MCFRDGSSFRLDNPRGDDWDGEFDDRLLKELEDSGFHVNQQELDIDK